MSQSRLSILISVFMLLVIIPAVAQNGEVAGRNVNMVSGKGWPGGDPFLQRQNEPSIDVSTRNPMHILAGANDYRTVDIPFVDTTGEEENGDAWLGVFKSFDGGARWQSILLPGYPQDVSPEGLSSPLHGYGAAADPTVRAGTNGLFYYSGIVFNRGPQGQVPSAVFVSRFIDNNNKENGDPTKLAPNSTPTNPIPTPTDAIRYIDTQIVGQSRSLQFVDKPALAVDVPRDNSKCNIMTTQNGKMVKQNIASGQVYVAYTVFLDSDPNVKRSRIMFARSSTCGQNFTHPFDISKNRASQEGDDDDNTWDGPGQNNLNLYQSPAIAIDPNTGTIWIAFRRFNKNGFSDAIMITKSTDGGKHFIQAVALPSFTSSNLPFDEPTNVTPFAGFRFNSYPTLTVDNLSRIYLAWSSRGFGSNPDPTKSEAHIVLSTSADGGIHWSVPTEVDPLSTQDANENPSQRGSQLMPSLTFAAGKVMLLHYDLRLDSTYDTLFCPFGPGNCNPTQLQNLRKLAGDLDLATPLFEHVFEPFVIDAGKDFPDPPNTYLFTSKRRHTLDVRATQIDPMTQQATSVRISQYNMGSGGDPSDPNAIEQLQFNAGDLPMFIKGTAPFMGDYIDIAPSPRFILNASGKWIYNTDPANGQVYHAAWTDNRDVHKPANGDWSKYTPPCTLDQNGNLVCHTKSIFDGSDTTQYKCDLTNPGNAGSRDQNIYTSLITPGVFISSPANSKPLGTIIFGGKKVALQRAFVVTVQNATSNKKSFHLHIVNQPAGNGGDASFLQFTHLIDLDVDVAPLSTSSRSVFVKSPLNPSASVTVQVTENGTGTFQGNVVLNPDPTSPDLLNPDVANPDVANPDVANAEVYNPDVANPDVANPDVANPDVANPDVANPDVANPDVANPDVANPDVANPDVANPDVANPDVANPDVANPDVANPDVANSDLGDGLSDANWSVTNNGNTTAGYSVKLASNTILSGKFQLLLRKVYTTPTAQNCALKVTAHNVLIANIPSNVFHFASPTDSFDTTAPPPADVNNTTISLAPGETAKITLRGNVSLKTMRQIVTTSVTPVVVPQAVNTTIALSNGGKPLPPPLTIATTVLPAVTPCVECRYSATLFATGGTKPYTWSIDPTTAPAGFAVTPNADNGGATAQITGPAFLPPPGRFAITVQITDSSTQTQVDTKTFPLFTALTVTTTSLPQGKLGVPYNSTLTAIGGVPPITWSSQPAQVISSLVSSAASSSSGLPPGLTLDPSTGILSGVPNAPGNYSFIVTAADAENLGVTATQTLSIFIPAPLAVSTTTLPDGVANQLYNATLQATNGDGNYTWSATGLPNNFTLDPATGGISGASKVGVISDVTLTVTDGETPPQVASAKLRLRIFPVSLSGFGTAVIDGVFSPGEWDGAAQYAVQVNTPQGTPVQATMYVMNDATDMYLAFRYPRSAGTTNQFSVQFSNDNSGVLKNGDDMLRQIPQTGFFDEVLTNQSSECSPNTPPGGCLAEDTDGRLLGTKDGQGAFRANPPAGVPDDGFATYEIAHPLSSGDASDFALSIGQATGFIGSLQIGPTVTTFPATDATFPPGAQNYGRIVVHDLPQFGFVTDPKGDAIGGTTPRPDLLSANAAFTGTSLVMNVHFASNTYNPQATITQFLLDTDQNPATGNPGSDSSGVTDAGIIGVDYFVQVNPDGTATLFKYAGSVNSYSVVPNVTPIVVALSDGFQVTVPLAAIGNPFNVNFKVVDASQIGAGTFTGVQDYMPDVGKPAGSTGTTIL